MSRMSRSYRMRHHTEAPNPLIVEPHRPTQITVRMMNGVEHILFTERAGETYGDVKRVLYPYIVLPDIPFIVRSQLTLLVLNNDGSYNLDQPLNDAEIVPENDVVVELILKEPTWTREQEEVLRRMSRLRGEILSVNNHDTPDKIEAALWYIQNNPPTRLSMDDMNIHKIRSVLNVLRNTSITRLMLSGSNLDVDETREVFEMIGQISTLRDFVLRGNRNDGLFYTYYRMNDLVDLLRNTSLHRVVIDNSNIVFDGDFSDELLAVVNNQYTLEILSLNRNKCQSTENARKFIESTPLARLLSNDEISLDWIKP